MSITFVIGGASSGKSRFAESLAHDPKYYLATAQAFDDEMRTRIANHQLQRGKDWVTFDAPLDLAETIKHADGKRHFILVDCLTLWLSNVILAELDWEEELEKVILAIGTIEGDAVIVSNEVGHGIVPDNALGRTFRDAQGVANQAVAEIAETVVFVTAGLPMVLKGQLQEQQSQPREPRWRPRKKPGQT
jgi:adenosylcobinamide kinase / adenosylcobinamide-phosphate guanylyltransferase